MAQKHIDEFKVNMEAEGYQELVIDYETMQSNEKRNIVISFQEGDVAPMYMGVYTFEISEENVKDIRK